jgi:hypothetical protein
MKISNRFSSWLFARKIVYAFWFALFLGTLITTGTGIYLIQTVPLLYWTEWDLLGIGAFGNLECPVRLRPSSSAEMCLNLTPPDDAPDLLGSPEDVMIVTSFEGAYNAQTKLPVGKTIAVDQWFGPSAGPSLRWCRKVHGSDFLSLGGRVEKPVLVAVSAPVDFGGRHSKHVIASCSIFLQDPLAAGAILVRLLEFLLVAANVGFAGLFWFVSWRSLNLASRGLWKIILPQVIASLVVILLFLSFLGPFDWVTGTLIFPSDPGVYQSDLRMRGWGILAASFFLAAACAPIARRIYLNVRSKSCRPSRSD